MWDNMSRCRVILGMITIIVTVSHTEVISDNYTQTVISFQEQEEDRSQEISTMAPEAWEVKEGGQDDLEHIEDKRMVNKGKDIEMEG